MVFNEQENHSEEQKREVQRLYEELNAKINKLCEEADEELAKIQRQERELNEEPA